MPLPTVQVATSSLQIASTTPNTAPQSIDNSGLLPFVTNVTATPGATSTLITWDTLNQVSDSEVMFGTSTSYTATTTGDLSLVHSITLKDLLPGSVYHYKVSSTNGYGTVTSPDATFTTPGFAGTNSTTSPNISLLTVTPPTTSLDNTALISWTTDQPTSAYVLYGTSAQYTQTARANADIEVEPGEEHIFLISGLVPGETYHYMVVSENAAGSWRATADATFTTGSQD